MLREYWKDRRVAALLLCVCGAVFAAVFYLYALPVRAVGYASLLCGLVLLLAAAVDYRRYARRHAALARLLALQTLADVQPPEPNGLLQQDYTALLAKSRRETAALVSQTDAARTEMLDYYTLWAHQIKTPLAATSVLLQTLQAPQRAQLQAELFKTERYVEMVLQYLRMEDMSADLCFAPCALDETVRRAVKKYAPQFIHQKITLQVDALDETVLTDEKWLCFVIEQVVSNALKYTPQGGAVHIYRAAPSVLAIEDTGIGIAAEDLPRVFEKGFTGFNGRMDKKSTGLGLYLCKRVCEKLLHRIELQSKQGVGTCVLLHLQRPEPQLLD